MSPSLRVVLAASAAGWLAAAAACGKRGAGDGATCEAAGARFLDLARQQVAAAVRAGDLDARTRGAVEGHLPAIRDALVRACKVDGWPPEARACFATARDDLAIRACYQALSPEHRALLEQASAASLLE